MSKNTEYAYGYMRMKIETDPNYQSGITNEALMGLVVDEKGNARHTPRKSAIAIQPANDINTAFGKVYQIKIARKGYIVGDGYPVWHIDDSAMILVRKEKGEVTFHNREDALKGNFNQPLSHLSLDKFLNQECLHKKQSELQK